MAADDKERYKREMDAFKAAGGEPAKKAAPKAKSKKAAAPAPEEDEDEDDLDEVRIFHSLFCNVFFFFVIHFFEKK
jgi:hypothetical protein